MSTASTHSPQSLDRDSHHELLHRAETLAAAIELQSTLDTCHEFDEAASIATHSLSEWLRAEGAVLCWRNRPDAGLKCISDHAHGGGTFAANHHRETLAAGEEACL